MGIQVECNRCGSRYRAPEDWAGRLAKCPKCGAKVKIPAPEIELESLASMDELFEEELEAPPVSGPAAVSEAAGHSSLFGKFSSSTGRLPNARSQGEGDWKQFVLGHKLVTAVALMTAWLLLNLVVAVTRTGLATNQLFALVLVVVGVVIALIGLRPQSARHNRATYKRWAARMAVWFGVGVVGIGAAITGVMIGGSLHVSVPMLATLSGPFFVVFGIIALVSSVILIYLLLVLLFPKLNVFLVTAWGFLGFTGLVLTIGLLALWGNSHRLRGTRVDMGNPQEPFAIISVPLPRFPERGPQRAVMAGVDAEQVLLNVPAGAPGYYSRLRIYTPSGSHRPHSLPCILIAPAGTNLISGSHMDNDAKHPEHIPYVLAGYAVVAFELDGEYPSKKPTDAQVRRGFKEFAAAGAGLVNARNALEYVLAKVPEVDPNRIFAAGHSSAGTLALLFAEHERRLRGCVAFAPVNSLPTHFGRDASLLCRLIPDMNAFMVKSSPKTHAGDLHCPLFLFHARDDSIVPVTESMRFVRTLKSYSKDVTFELVASGDHYDAMINDGIPRAIEWLAAHGGVESQTLGQVGAADTAPAQPATRQTMPPRRTIPRAPNAPAPALRSGAASSAMVRDTKSATNRAVRRPAASSGPSARSRSVSAKKTNDAELDEIIRLLRARKSNTSNQGGTLLRLAAMQPIEARREEVAALLDTFLRSRDRFIELAALRATAVWGTARNVPAVLEQLKSSHLSAKLASIHALGAIDDPRAIDALVQLVPDRQHGMTAANTLSKAGPRAEDAVITLLNHEDHQVRYRACHVLEKIGGPKSIAALKAMLKRDTNTWSRSAAKGALWTLSRRKNK